METRILKLETGYQHIKSRNRSWKPETWNQKLETRNWRPETENQTLETRNWKLETGNQKLETRNCRIITLTCTEIANVIRNTAKADTVNWKTVHVNHNSESRIQNLEFRIQNPESGHQKPESGNQKPELASANNIFYRNIFFWLFIERIMIMGCSRSLINAFEKRHFIENQKL